MAEPGFFFYPGDYLRDTQCLTEQAQVAYDRIMCEHMRNICSDVSNITLSKDRVNFFIKRLDEKSQDDIWSVLRETPSGFQIPWVSDSMAKWKKYSESRSKNRSSKSKKDMKTYVKHMEEEEEIEEEKDIEYRKKAFSEKIDIEGAQYTPAMRKDFIEYWTEKNQSGKKMRFEMEKVFDISKRLSRWHQNNLNRFGAKQAGKTNKHVTIGEKLDGKQSGKIEW